MGLTDLEINTGPFPKIGNLTSGYGLASVFDGSNSTSAYTPGTLGWVGINFSGAPKKVEKVEIVPADNGFDASGSTSPIILSLRAKKGSAPTGASDGVLLGSLSFIDVNYYLTRTLISTDQLSAWDFVWVSISTGVWASASELRVFESEAVVSAPIAPATTTTVYQKACNSAFSLPQAVVEVPGFTFDIAADEAGVALVDYRVNVAHVGNLFSPTFLGAIGTGAQFTFKYSHTFPGLDSAAWQVPANSKSNGVNIDERNPAHYANVGLSTSIPIQPGFYRFTLFMTAHTDGDTRDGLAQVLVEGGKGLNGLRVTVVKGGQFQDMSK